MIQPSMVSTITRTQLITGLSLRISFRQSQCPVRQHHIEPSLRISEIKIVLLLPIPPMLVSPWVSKSARVAIVIIIIPDFSDISLSHLSRGPLRCHRENFLSRDLF